MEIALWRSCHASNDWKGATMAHWYRNAMHPDTKWLHLISDKDLLVSLRLPSKSIRLQFNIRVICRTYRALIFEHCRIGIKFIDPLVCEIVS